METQCLFTEGHRYAVAFSGGLDSSTLLVLAKNSPGVKVVAFLGVGVNFPAAEQAEAMAFCREQHIELVKIPFDPLAIPEFRTNVPERCYFCKKALFTSFREMADRLGLELVDGTNPDDLKDYRPGLRAVQELGVRSPFLEAGLGKQQIRKLARKLGLGVWDKPSQACLASRIPFGREITASVMETIDRVEEEIRRLENVDQVRVRLLSEGKIRVETLPYQRNLSWQIYDLLRRSFPSVERVIMHKYRTGSLNKQKY